MNQGIKWVVCGLYIVSSGASCTKAHYGWEHGNMEKKKNGLVGQKKFVVSMRNKNLGG